MYLTMENDPNFEFEFYLADRLGTTVADMRETMSNEEFLGWLIYHGRVAQKKELAIKMASSGRR